MSIVKKVILSIVPISVLLFVMIDFFVTDLLDFESYEKIWWVMLTLSFIFYFLLINIILRKNISKDKKMYYILLSLFILPYSLYYIWFTDNENN